jgi:phage-related protein
MSLMTYTGHLASRDKPLAWLHVEVKSPPFSRTARVETGFLLRRLQRGERLAMPQSRPMPGIGPRCHELRIKDVSGEWRLIYRIDADAIVIAAVFAKKSARTRESVIGICRRRLQEYDNAGN